VGLQGPNLGAGLAKLAHAIEGGTADAVEDAAKQAKAIHAARISSDSGGDNVLSGVGKSKGRKGGAKVGVHYRITKRKASASGFIKATGPLHFLDRPTKARTIRSAHAFTRGGRRRNIIGPTKAGVLFIPGIGYRAWANHPGTRGKGTWTKAAKEAQPVIKKALGGRMVSVVKKGAKIT